jgi:DNA polymerase-1
VQEATRLRQRFFQAYRGLRDWQRVQGNGPRETRTVRGRRRLDVRMFTEKLNTPVQGSGADGLKAALALLWATRDKAPGAAPVLCVHDEIVVECDAATAEQTKEWLVGCMKAGMETVLHAVPVVVEATICPDWSAKAS